MTWCGLGCLVTDVLGVLLGALGEVLAAVCLV